MPLRTKPILFLFGHSASENSKKASKSTATPTPNQLYGIPNPHLFSNVSPTKWNISKQNQTKPIKTTNGHMPSSQIQNNLQTLATIYQQKH
jgi:hypothetical protein